MRGFRSEARGVTHHAVDIRDCPAAGAHDVVVVVTHAQLVARRGASGFDAASNGVLGEVVQHVVHRLDGRARQRGHNRGKDVIGRRMRLRGERGDHREAWLSDAQAGITQERGGVGLGVHAATLAVVFSSSK